AELDLAGAPILARPFETGVILFARCMPGEIGVLEVAARERAHVGAARRDDGVDVAVADDASHRHGWDVQLGADLIAEGRLEGAPLRGPLDVDDAAGRTREYVVAGAMKHAGDLDAVFDRVPALGEIDRRNPRADRLVRRPRVAHGTKDLQGKPHAVLQ